MSEYHIPPSPVTFFILFYLRRKSAASIDSMESCLSTTRFCWSFLNELFFIPVLLLLLNYQPFFLDLLVNDAWSPRKHLHFKGWCNSMVSFIPWDPNPSPFSGKLRVPGPNGSDVEGEYLFMACQPFPT